VSIFGPKDERSKSTDNKNLQKMAHISLLAAGRMRAGARCKLGAAQWARTAAYASSQGVARSLLVYTVADSVFMHCNRPATGKVM